MQLAKAIPGIWVYTTGDAYNAMRPAGYWGFLSKPQQARVERVRQSRLLFEGKHRQYFLDEQRTQFDFPAVRVGDRVVEMYLTLNVLKLISKKSADLLFGQEPLLRVDDEIQQARLTELAERGSLHKQFYNAAVESSYEGECFLEACVKNGQVYLRRLPADETFAEGELGPDGQFGSYVRFAVEDVGTRERPIFLLLETRYLPGSIERRLWQLDEKGDKGRELKLDQWPHKPADGTALQPSTPTGIARNTVTWVPNELHHDQPVSDYDGLIDLQDELNAKQTQIGRVLAKHSDPKLAVPRRMADEQGNMPAGHDVTFFDTKDEIPQYVVWNAELDQARQDRSFTLNALLITAETSPVLLGLKEGAAPDAYRKLRLEAQNSLTKAQRKATNWKPGIRRAVTVAQELEQTIPGNRYDTFPIAAEMRDGIPVDEGDQANTLVALHAERLISTRRALEVQLGDSAAVEKELAEIKKERDEATPNVLLGGGATAAADGLTGGAAPATEDEGVAA